MQQEPQQHPAYAPQPPSPSPELPKPQQSPQYSGQSFYQPATEPQYAEPQEPSEHIANKRSDAISWDASEYIQNDKGAPWILGLLAVVAVFAGVAFWLQAWTFLALILVMGLAMGIVAFRKPHTMHYELSGAGISINDRLFHYNDFRAFGVIKQGAFFMLTFIPVKRFAPAINVYFDGKDGEKIVDLAGAHLPMEQLKPDPIDTLMRRLHF